MRPPDATLSVTRAARFLGVHPNTVRAWSDQGRLRCYRINARGDRRYRLGDLERFIVSGQTTVDPSPSGLPDRAGSDGRSAAASEPGSWPDLREAPDPDLGLMALLADTVAVGRPLDACLASAARILRDAWGLGTVGLWERRAGRLVPRAMAGPGRAVELPEGFGIAGRCLEARSAVVLQERDLDGAALMPGHGSELATPVPGAEEPWGVLWMSAGSDGLLGDRELVAAEAAARVVAAAVRSGRRAEEVTHRLHRAEALRRVADDIGSRTDLDRILSSLADHLLVLFEADRAALYLRRADGGVTAEVTRGLSPAYAAATREFRVPSLVAEVVDTGRIGFAVGYRDDPRGMALRAAVVQEGFDTICAAPLLSGGDVLGVLAVYHDQPHAWSREELETMQAFCAQASVAIKAATDFTLMATWAAQLQSIQELGSRLNHLTTVNDIGEAIASELRELIDNHNARVYRVYGDDLVPVAIRGQVGEYEDETPDQLRLHVGQGITGWVARHGVAQYLPDAAADPRSQTIPGTDDDLPESMLLAPMIHEGQVLGVLVLSKLGIDRFTADDLRLLEIYASLAAGAMANADATERLRAQSATLERQLHGQRELLRLTESLLTTLDPSAVLEQVASRLDGLVRHDNLWLEHWDRAAGILRPLAARGVDAPAYLADAQPADEGIAGWVLANDAPVLVRDIRLEPRIRAVPGLELRDASLIVVPLRDRSGASGLLLVERLGQERPFEPDEFELVQLFAAQVSIALQNATVHAAVEARASTDDRTGLLNHGAFVEHLVRAVADGAPFGLVMVDLDDFRRVNNRFGHQAGDRFLGVVGAAIQEVGRGSDLAFRYGGDEFTLILPGADEPGVRLVAGRVREAIRRASVSVAGVGGAEVDCSVGLAVYPRDGATADGILLAADRACFVAKRGGRGRIAGASEGLALAGEFALSEPTPIDPLPASLGRPGPDERASSEMAAQAPEH
jgi:diguanylate cyclase (GGDEF)-like protein